MLVLVSSTPGAGHVQALAPLAVALRAAGHDVRWAIAPDGVASVEQLGFTAVPAGMTVLERRDFLAPDVPRIMELPPEQRRGHLFAGYFAVAAAPRMRVELAPVVDELRPALVVHEAAELAAAPIAAARDIPHVSVAFSGALPEPALPLVLEAVAPVWRAEGVGLTGEDALTGARYFHPFPPSFGGIPRVTTAVPMRPVGLPVSGRPPSWLAGFAVDRPGVYLTAGTEPFAPTAPWAAAVAAIGALDVDAVATLGGHVDRTVLGTLPPNLRVERYVPQAFLVDRLAVVMSHGGAGTVLGAASCGIPQVVTPLFADQWENAMAVAGSGAGVLLPPERRAAADIREALERALGDGAMRAAATRVAAEIAAMPTAEDHVPGLEQLAATRRDLR